MSTRPARRLVVRLALGLAVASATFLATVPAASAHPLGNFTTNTAATLRVSPDGITLRYAIDSAEIPTVRATESIDTDRNGTSSKAELAAHADTTCRSVARKLRVTVDGDAIRFERPSGIAALSPGAAGLRTLRVDCSFRASIDLSSDTHVVRFADRWVGDRIGWHEVTASGSGMRLSGSSVPRRSSSDELRSYPAAAIDAPPDVVRATFTATRGSATDGPAATEDAGRRVSAVHISAVPGVDDASDSFTDLVSREQLTLGVALLGLVLAIVLGSLHALAPGHGKTVMAAYLLGGEGSGRQALALCATVTVTHTAGVLVLGTVLTVSTVVAPQRLYPILGAISGLLVASIGFGMLRRARRTRLDHALLSAVDSTSRYTGPTHSPSSSRTPIGIPALVGARAMSGARPTPRTAATPVRAHGHAYDREHDHDHGAAAHSHGAHSHVHPDMSGPVTWKSLIAMGFAGGMVPSPSALLVLLGAIALGRTWFGVALVVAYGAGMAIALVAAGLLLLRLRNRLDRFLSTRGGRRWARRMTVVPTATAVLVVVGGIYIAVRAAILA